MRFISLLLIVGLAACAPKFNTAPSPTPAQTTNNCITLQDHQTYWSAAAKGLAVLAGVLPGVGIPWAIGAAVGALAAGAVVMADGDYSDYLLYGCPVASLKSEGTHT